MPSPYIDFFVIPVPKKNLAAYRTLSKKSAKAWMRAGAVEYVETLAHDAPQGKQTSFPQSVKLKSGEVVAMGYVVYKSSAHRKQVQKKIYQDTELMALWDQKMPFDGMRMVWGGFKSFISL